MSRVRANPWIALCALCIGFFMIMLDTTIVFVAIPAMLRGLHASLNEVIWVTSGYLLAYAVPLLVCGRLGDWLGRKPVFITGLVVFTGASLWCGLSGSAAMLIAARVVQGLGAALMTPQTMAFITHLFPPSRRGAPMGMWGAVAGIATIAGPLLGGLLVDSLGWQWIFMVNVPIGVIGLVMTILLVPGGQRREQHSFDLVGIALSGLGLLCVVFGLQNGQQYHWGQVLGGLSITEIIGVGVLLLVAFVVWERVNRAEPLLPLSLFRHRTFSSANVANMTIGFTMSSMFLPLVIYVQSVRGLSPFLSGLVTAPMSLVAGIVAPFAGRLSDRISGKYVAMTGFLALALGVGIISAHIEPTTSPWTLVPAMLVCGFGIGCVFSPLANLATGEVELPMMGAASGIFNTARQVGSVVGSAAVGVLLQARLTASLHTAAVTQAAQLPGPYRQPFVSGLDQAANSATEVGTGSGGPALPPSVPADIAHQIGQLAVTAFHSAFTQAAKETLLLPVAVLLVGVLACVAMSPRRRSTTPSAPPARPTEVPAGLD